MWETIIGSLIGSGIPVLGGLYLLSVRNKREAARRFREAFNPELAKLRHPAFEEAMDSISPYLLLRSAFERHRIAKTEYEQFLSGGRLSDFDRAWRNYYAYDDTDEHSHEDLLKYSPNDTGKTDKECRELAIANIEKLLHFARHGMGSYRFRTSRSSASRPRGGSAG